MADLILPTPALAAHQGEETAEYLSSDADLYLTVNLDPGAGQLIMFMLLANYWLRDSDFQDDMGDLLGELEDEVGIDIMEDVLPWLGPEVAVGVQNITAQYPEEPEVVVFIGTTDKQASDVAFEKYKALQEGENTYSSSDSESWGNCSYSYSSEGGITFTNSDYRGVVVVTENRWWEWENTDTCDGEEVNSDSGSGEEDTGFYAITDDYILFSNNEDTLESTIDLMLDGGDSLADNTDFKAAQDALPSNRVGMLYGNMEQIWEGAVTDIMDTDWLEGILDSFNDQIPPCFAASVSLADKGISMTAYCPLLEGAMLPSVEPASLQSTQIVPGDAVLFASGQDANAYWEEIRSLIADNWEDLVQGLELPTEINAFIGNLDTFDTMIDGIDSLLGVDIDTDIFGWMTSECSMALLSVPTTSNEFPDILIIFEVEDTSAVDGYLNDLIDVFNNPFLQGMIGNDFNLSTTETELDGIDATLFTNDAIDEAGASPGWLFLDVGSTHYLALGTTTDALAGAVDASQGDILSLDEAGEYQDVLSMLPETRMALGYLDLAQIFDGMVSGMSAEMMSDMASEMMPSEGMLSELGSAEFDIISLITSYFPSQCAVGCSITVDDSDGVVVSGALHILPPPLVKQSIAKGTGTLEIPEQMFDFTQVDMDVGKCAVSLDVDIEDAPDGASIELVAMNSIPEDIKSGFALAAEGADLSIEDIAYVIRVDKTNLTDDNVGTATITMKVDKNWADDYDEDSIKIIRISDDGTEKEVLLTTRGEDEGDYAVFVGTSENGLSYFGVVAVSSAGTGGTNWALIGGIIGAVLLVIIVFAVIIRTRRRTT